MKLIRFGDKNHEKPGVLVKGKRLDCSAHFEDWNNRFFNGDGLTNLEDLLTEEINNLPVVSGNERWASCIARPSLILCIGLNYADHAKEANMELPAEPLVFSKASNTIAGPYDGVVLPRAAEKVDYEIELGVVLGKDVFELRSVEEAEKIIAGYCLANDLSERAFQLEKGGQWIKGKSCPGFCPAGPFLATRDEISDPNNLNMQLKVNSEIRQDGNTKTMVFKPAYTIYYLSQFMKLEAGDLILTGTPPGVAMGMKQPKYLKDNDVIELSLDGLGEQKTRFVKG
jgi:2-keto-4-pentenoate hydratase/2-oxohepta-3-ene-1,7-dioic acid hydratase in catechol pathway